MNAEMTETTDAIDSLPAPGEALYPRNDTERAVRFAEEFGSDLRYVETWKSWFLWDGTRWSRDRDGHVERLAQEMPKLLLKEAEQVNDFEKQKKLWAEALRSGDAVKLHAMLQLARSQSGIATRAEIFDADPYLFCVRNGVVDLRNGSSRVARREDYLTKQASIAYDREARCPQWIEHLRTVFKGNESLVSFLQDAVGYSLTGATSEQCLFFLNGTGRNGKSTTTETLQALLGDYAQHAPAALFMLDKSGREPETEIARLVGARLVIGSEIEEGARLAEARVKNLTGQDTLTGRFLYSSSFDFKPTHKLFIFGNHRPDVSGNDFAIWRRIRLIPFEVQIEESKVDPQLPAKLAGELPGILNWAIEGCLRWQKEGLKTPTVVTQATAEYRDEEDELGEFIEENCVVGPKFEVTKSALHRDYQIWASMQGVKMPLKPKAFAKRMRARGFLEGKRGGVRYWSGILVGAQIMASISTREGATKYERQEAQTILDSYMPPSGMSAGGKTR